MRTPIIAGNWKMNKTVAQAVGLVKEIHYGHSDLGEVEVVVAPPFTALADVVNFAKDSYLNVAAQNVFWEESGAISESLSQVHNRTTGISLSDQDAKVDRLQPVDIFASPATR